MLEIIALPALVGSYDNYIWLLHDDNNAIVIDPGVAEPVLNYLQQHQLTLSAILITHRHHDHIGGIAELAGVYNTPVYVPRSEWIAGGTHPVSEGDCLKFAAPAAEFQVLEIPGHTLGHVAYWGENSLFCGDTLFGCGCGKMFEGTPSQFHQSLQRIAALPEETQIYCAHEYTERNLAFALKCEPNNIELNQRDIVVKSLRKNGLPSVPFSLATEKATNPFLRCTQAEVIASLHQHFPSAPAAQNEIEVFAGLRKWRDEF